MAAERLRALALGLAELSRRQQAADELAVLLGASAVLLFVRDPELQVFLPAPGMRQTLRGDARWREFLRRCLCEGQVACDVEVDGREQRAVAQVHGVLAFVALGLPLPATLPGPLLEVLPFVDIAARAQYAHQIGMAEAAEAREQAARSHHLAKALDAARASAAELNNKLRQEHQRKDEFLATLAHELRNPLAPIVSTVEILRRTGGGDVQQREQALAVMSRQIEQLARLVDDLMDVSRVSRRLVELRREILSLADILAVAEESVRPFLNARSHTLRRSGEHDGVFVRGDRVRLIQVFSNLLNNAAKYTDPHGQIDLSVIRVHGRVSVVVRDNGSGIPKDMLDGIFDMFTQVPGSLSRAPGGLGIGLTLVRMLVTLHGGSVHAHSVGPGRGSTFTVTLPTVPAPAVPPAQVSPGEPPMARELPVLIVDDNLDAAQSLAELIRMMGARVEVAADGMQALEKTIGGFTPRLVLLDLGLPGMDGFETAREWRRRFGDTAMLVALTGYGSPDDKRRTAAAGFDKHLVKPVDVAAIAAVLGECAAGKRARAAAGSVPG
jgi:signal transduction histidine kinase/ActR/RegA family two-component response regulator